MGGYGRSIPSTSNSSDSPIGADSSSINQDDSSLPGAPAKKSQAKAGSHANHRHGERPNTSGVLLKKDPDMHKEPLGDAGNWKVNLGILHIDVSRCSTETFMKTRCAKCPLSLSRSGGHGFFPWPAPSILGCSSQLVEGNIFRTPFFCLAMFRLQTLTFNP